MFESLLPVRAQAAYRQSHFKARLDDCAARLFRRNCAMSTIGSYLVEWVDFVQGYELAGALPEDVSSVEVTGYLELTVWLVATRQWRCFGGFVVGGALIVLCWIAWMVDEVRGAGRGHQPAR